MPAAIDVIGHDPTEYRTTVMYAAINAVIEMNMVNQQAGVVDLAPAIDGLAEAIAYLAIQDPQYRTRHGAKRLARDVAHLVEKMARGLAADPTGEFVHSNAVPRSLA